MQLLKIAALVAFGSAALGVLAAMQLHQVIFVSVAATCAGAGTVFLALDRIINLLEKISRGLGITSLVEAGLDHNPAPAMPTRSIDEIKADIDRMKSKM